MKAQAATVATTLGLSATLLLAVGQAGTAATAASGPWRIEATAGGPGGPGPAGSVNIGTPCAVTFAGTQLYVDAGLIRSVSIRTGRLTTPVGTVDRATGGNGSPATTASVAWPCGLTTDHAGNLLIADGEYFADGSPNGGDNEIRVVPPRSGTFYGQKMTAGDIYTVAGSGHDGFSGDGGPATAADLSLTPQGDGKIDLSEPWPMLRIDHAGNIVLGDSNSCHIRVVAARTGTVYGQKMTADDIYTIAGHGACGYSGDGGPATSARLGVVTGVAPDGAGNVVFSDMGSITLEGKDGTRVRVVAARTGRFYGISMRAGDIYTVAGDGQLGTSGNGGLATRAKFAGPAGVTVDSAGNIVVADGQGYGDQQAYYSNDRVRAIAARSGRYYGVKMTAGHIYSIAGTDSLYTGNGGLAIRAQIDNGNANNTSFGTTGMTLDRYGNQVITDLDDGKILVVAARAGRFYGIAMRAAHIYSVAGGGTGFPGGGRPASQVRLTSPTSVTTDSAGNLLMALYGANRLSVLAARSGRFYGQRMTAGRVYLIAGNGGYGPAGFGGPALKAALTPTYLHVDHHGNVVISDSPDGYILVVAGRTGAFYGRKMTAGHIYRVAGNGDAAGGYANGVVATATPVYASGVAVDAAGNLVICDDSRVRVVAASTGTFYGLQMTAGHIYAIAGDGHYGDSGNGGPALQATISPDSAALDAAGNVVVADGGGYIRVIAARTGTFYGQSMTAGDIYRVAGGGSSSLSSGPALDAEFYGPTAVAVARGGHVYFADGFRVWMIEP